MVYTNSFMKSIRISIVVYKTDPALLHGALESVHACSLPVQVTVIDNSPTDELRVHCPEPIEYLFLNQNTGYGRAHNIALRTSLHLADYHLVLNPDVHFQPGTLEKLFYFMEAHPHAGAVIPKVYSPEGELQMMCKLLPAPMNLISRRFAPFPSWFKSRNDQYEMKSSGYDRVMNVPFVSGCFMFLRTSALKEVGLFDERFFLYAEDTDLSRRIHQKFQTLFFPDAHITHVHARGSYKNLRHTFQNAVSAIQYFNKWGWFFDAERRVINQQAIQQSSVEGSTSPSLRQVRAA